MVAIATLLLGDNIYERFTGKSLFLQNPSPTPIPITSSIFNTNTPFPAIILVDTNTPIPATLPTVNTITPAPTISSIEFVASISRNVKDLRFYESDGNVLPLDQRVYSTRFMRETARYINWQLELASPQPGQRIDFIIHAVYYRSDGSVFAEEDHNAYVLSAWTNSYHYSGWGWNNADNWEMGAYTVVLYVNNMEIARASFRIE